VEEIQNQNPLNPTDTSEFLNQMMSYASYSQLSEMNSTLLSLQEAVDTISSGLTTTTA
jgi:Flagellar hook capping protein.